MIFFHSLFFHLPRGNCHLDAILSVWHTQGKAWSYCSTSVVLHDLFRVGSSQAFKLNRLHDFNNALLRGQCVQKGLLILKYSKRLKPLTIKWQLKPWFQPSLRNLRNLFIEFSISCFTFLVRWRTHIPAWNSMKTIIFIIMLIEVAGWIPPSFFGNYLPSYTACHITGPACSSKNVASNQQK